MRPTLLMFNFSGERAKQLRFAAMRLALAVKEIPEEDFLQPLGALCGMAERIEPTGVVKAFTDEMLVMADFPQDMISRFLLTMRQMKLPPVPLKAILTETNASWNACQLHEQLSAEHQAMTQGKTIHE